MEEKGVTFLRDRFDRTISGAFHDLLSRAKVEHLLDALEQDVKEWLRDYS